MNTQIQPMVKAAPQTAVAEFPSAEKIATVAGAIILSAIGVAIGGVLGVIISFVAGFIPITC